MKLIIALSLMALAGCQNTMAVLEGTDYICITGDLTGRWTGSQIDGRGIKLPEGESLTPETIEALCP